MGRIWNDGYDKLKGKRVETSGSQLPEIFNAFNLFKQSKQFSSQCATTIKGETIIDGQEFSPQQWLPEPRLSLKDIHDNEQKLVLSMFQAISSIPEIADEVLEDFTSDWSDLPSLNYDKKDSISFFFKVLNGKSSGERNYSEGNCPYISSGDTLNSIIRLVADEDEELFPFGAITVTAFGQAYIQPWRFLARGNGGSSVRVLIPKYKMTVNELLWFASQINAQKWRFFYGRMAIKSRLERLEIVSPPKHIADSGKTLSERINQFKNKLFELSKLK